MEKFIKWGFDQRLVRDSWNGGTNLSFEKDLAYGYSWPQRNYRCSFCRKEFKSAQALGGHMNVHRRDRARMRSSPSWDSTNPNPSSLYSSSTWSPISSAPKPYNNHSSLTAVTNSSSSPEQVQIIQHSQLQILNLFGGDNGSKSKGGGMLEFTRRKDARVWKAKKVYTKEGLDLELRLGCS